MGCFPTQNIRSPLAAQGVPKWRWQNCALAVENDEYDRDQETQSIQGLQGSNRSAVANFDARINAAQHQFPKLLDQVKSACPYTKDIAACEGELQELASLPPEGFLDNPLIASYRSIIPQVDAAISADMQTAASGQASLKGIADRVAKVYESGR